MANRRLGLWLVGARGGVATTVAVGCAALRIGRAGPCGLTSELPQFRELDFARWDEIVIGGHDIRRPALADEARSMSISNRVFEPTLLAEIGPELAEIDARIRPGTLVGAGAAVQQLADRDFVPDDRSPAAAIERLVHDLQQFREQEKLDRVVVLNLASTEPPASGALPTTWQQLEPRLGEVDCGLAASSLYAVAAFQVGAAYVNFTPSAGCEPPALQDLAVQRQVCHMGRDGKTGETLLKSVLAPMFANRNLQVLSWVGHNIFGNLDGKILDVPENKQSKVASKDQLLKQILNYEPQTLVTIEYIRSLGDWKTAWDHIHFQGFLNTPMVLQFTWQGCDSLLAAPLVLDLFRFTELAQRLGVVGKMPWLACFFKSPSGVAEQSFPLQFQMLEQWSRQCRK